MSLKTVRDGDDWLVRVRLSGWRDVLRSDDGSLMAILLPNDADPTLPPEAGQLTAAEFLEQHSTTLLTPILTAMRAHYDNLRPSFLGFLEKPDIQMPATPTVAEFIALHELLQVFIHCPTNSQPARIGFQFAADWEVEHGVGVLTEDLQVVDCGGADVAFS